MVNRYSVKKTWRLRVAIIVVVGLGGLVLSPLPASAAVGHAFGAHSGTYASGTLFPQVAAEVRDDAAKRYYFNFWKRNFLREGCGTGRWYVRTPDANVANVAEGQGYGMVISVIMAGADSQARTIFDGLYRFVKDHPSHINPNLMAAENNPCTSVNGSDSATDGDLDIAYALLMAHDQWGSGGAVNYLAEFKKRAAAIKQSEVHPTTRLMLLGDWAAPGSKYYTSARTSDFMISQFRAFRRWTGDPFWDSVVAAHQRLINTMQANYAPNTGLVPDFVVDTTTTPRPAPAGFLEGANDGRYSYNACRVPWRIAMDALFGGNATSRSQAGRMTAWIRTTTGGNPSNVRNGYTLAGTPLESTGNAIFIAPFGVAAMSGTSQAWVNASWNKLVSTSESSTAYYATALKLQAMLVMSGNVWVP
jgi:endo-1,4-beta-D-glucanase Y